MNFSWAMDLDPKGANNQIKEAIDKRYLPDDEGTATHQPGVSNVTCHMSPASPQTEQKSLKGSMERHAGSVHMVSATRVNRCHSGNPYDYRDESFLVFTPRIKKNG